jgi:hypothetical protein
MGEGRHRRLYITAGPLPFPNQWRDCKGPRPLLEVQEAKPPGGFKGKALALRRFWGLPRRSIVLTVLTVLPAPELAEQGIFLLPG